MSKTIRVVDFTVSKSVFDEKVSGYLCRRI